MPRATACWRFRRLLPCPASRQGGWRRATARCGRRPRELPLSFRPAFGEFEEFAGRYRWRVVLDLPVGEVEPCVP